MELNIIVMKFKRDNVLLVTVQIVSSKAIDGYIYNYENSKRPTNRFSDEIASKHWINIERAMKKKTFNHHAICLC